MEGLGDVLHGGLEVFQFFVEGFLEEKRVDVHLPTVLLDLLDDEQEVKWMQQVALQLEFLIVVDAVEDVGRDLQKLLDEGLVGEFAGVAVDLLQHLVVALECLPLELLVSVDLVALCF